jgi:hypothetical protein
MLMSEEGAGGWFTSRDNTFHILLAWQINVMKFSFILELYSCSVISLLIERESSGLSDQCGRDLNQISFIYRLVSVHPPSPTPDFIYCPDIVDVTTVTSVFATVLGGFARRVLGFEGLEEIKLAVTPGTAVL